MNINKAYGFGISFAEFFNVHVKAVTKFMIAGIALSVAQYIDQYVLMGVETIRFRREHYQICEAM